MNAVSYYKRRHSIHNGEISICFDIGDCDEDFSSDFIPNDQVHGNGNTVYQEPEIDSPQQEREQPPRALQMKSPMQLQLPFRWSIESKDVSELPEIYPRLSYPLIIRDSEVSEIGERLWAFLRINEVRSAYDIRQGKVLCCTDRVSFVVQFWRRRLQPPQSSAEVFGGCDTDCNRDVSHSNSGEEIILEIQRRQGCSWAMHKIRSALKKSILKHPQHNHNQSQSQQHHRSRRRHSTHTSSSFFPPPFSPLPMMRSHSHAGFSNSHQPLHLPSVVLPIPMERGEREHSQQHNHNPQHNYQYNHNQHKPERTHNFSFSSNPGRCWDNQPQQQQPQQAIPNEVIQQTIPNEVIVPADSDARSISPVQDDSFTCSRSVSPLR